jgi:hypothetical protein
VTFPFIFIVGHIDFNSPFVLPLSMWYSTKLSKEGDFTPTASMVGLGEKLGTDPRIGQPSCCGLGQEPFFSRAVALSIVIDDFVKGCYTWTP